MIRVLEAHVSMAESSDVQVGSDLFDLDTTVNPACGSVVNLVICRSVSRLLLLETTLLPTRE
jgi:hypothetical protein